MQGESGQRESDGISSFFADRNTAVCGAEVHILPLNFPLKKSSIWTAGTGVFYDEYFKDGFFDRMLNCSTMTTRAEGMCWRKRALPVARKAFNIISNYRDTLLAVAVTQWKQSPKRWRVRIISIMLFAVAERGI